MDDLKKQQIKKDIQAVLDYAFDDCKTHKDLIKTGALLQRKGFDECFITALIINKEAVMRKKSLVKIGANPLTDTELSTMLESEFSFYIESERVRINTLKVDFKDRISKAQSLEELGLVEENITLCGYSEFNESLKNRAVQIQETLEL